MRARCQYPTTARWAQYGGRGIKVCERWAAKGGFPAFLADVGPAPSPRHTLGRIDNDGDYKPGNVRWEEPVQQANNKSDSRMLTARGRTHTLGQWAAEVGIASHTLACRIDRYGWDVERAIFTPSTFVGRGTPRLYTHNGETLPLTAWAKRIGITHAALKQRLDDLGWPIERALTTPSRFTQE